MTKKVKMSLLIGLAAITLPVFTTAIIVGAEETSFKYVGDYFVGEGTEVLLASNDPSGKSSKRGVLLTFNEGGTVKVGDEFRGAFELEYLPVSMSSGASLLEWSLVFEDVKTKNAFSVNVQHGDTNNVSVAFEGVEAGIFYPSYPVLTNNGVTAVANGGGRYTEISEDDSFAVKFVPDEMSVYAITEGGEYLVWDMRVAKNDNYNVGRTLPIFGEYTVTLVGNETETGGGQAIVCAVNGYKTDETVFRSSTAPMVGTNVAEYGVVGEKYELGEIYAYDFLDGELPTTKRLTSPSGKAVRIVNGWFIPEETGDYVLSVSAENSFHNKTTQEYVITVKEEAEEYRLSYDAIFPEGEWAVGDVLYIPKLTVAGGRNVGELTKTATVTVYRNGVKMAAHTDVESGFAYTLFGEGEYKFVYAFWNERTEFVLQSVKRDCQFTCVGLANAVHLGTTIDLTGGKLLVEGEALPYDLRVEYPDGKAYGNTVFVADTVGKYTVYATAEKNGKKYVDEYVIEVYEHAGDMFTSEDAGTTFDFGVSKQTGRTGAKITTSKSNTPVVFEKEIDLAEYRNQTAIKGLGSTGDPVYGAKEDATPLIELSVEPIAYRVAATSLVRVYLRDAADLENFICIELANHGSTNWAYLRARATGQQNMGFDNGGNRSSYLNGTYGQRRTGSTFGQGIWYSFYGSIMSGHKNEDHTVKLYYDDEKKQVLTRSYSTNSNNLNEIVNDLDDTEWCNGPAWKGFTSNKAILSVEVGSVEDLNVEYFIYNAGGISFSQEEMKYSKGPQISVASEVGLYGVEGGKVEIPSATAADYYGKDVAQFATKVYYKRGETLYDIYTDGKSFIAPKAGEYIVKYVAVDVFGNVGEKSIAVDVKDKSYPALSAQITGGGDYKAGSLVRIQPIEGVQVFNELGKASVSVGVYYQDGDNEIPAVIDPRGDVFVDRVGVYVVRYTVKDEAQRTTTCEYEINVALDGVVAIDGSIPVYVGFVSGGSYDIADLTVKEYTCENPASVKTEIYIDGSKFEGGKYVAPTTSFGEEKSVKIEYKYNGSAVKEYDVPVVNIYREIVETVGGFNIKRSELNTDKAFVLGENTSLAIDGLFVRLTGGANNAATFINKTAVKGLKSQFIADTALDEEGNVVDNNVAAIVLTLVDASNMNKVIKVEYSPAGDSLALSVNGKPTGKTTTGSLDGVGTNRILFSYAYEDGTIRDASGSELCKLETFLNGDPFDGFGEYVYITYSVVCKDESKSASIRLYSLGNQSFSVTKSDQAPPSIYTAEEFVGGYYELGSEITVPAASSYDVISSVKNFTLSITYIDVMGLESKLLDGVDPSLARKLKLEKVGTYHIVWRAEDNNGNAIEKSVRITAFVKKDPIITLGGDVPKRGKLGETVKLPTYSVEYAVEQPENLSYIVIISPSNRYQMLDMAEFEPTERGVYRVRYFAIDAFGGYTILEYRISCE